MNSINKIPNISNIPNSQVNINNFLNLFSKDFFKIIEVYKLQENFGLNYSKESLRKVINHSTKIGILTKKNEAYGLSNLSLSYQQKNITFVEFIREIIFLNHDLFEISNSIIQILSIFNGHLNKKTFYYIFSLQTKQRKDKSSIESVGRNLRSIFSLMKMAKLIKENNSQIKLFSGNNFHVNNSMALPKSIEYKYKSDIYSIVLLRNDLLKYFSNDFSENILICVTSFEYEDIYWNRSSLNKNNGEVLNLFNEYIMTFTVK